MMNGFFINPQEAQILFFDAFLKDLLDSKQFQC